MSLHFTVDPEWVNLPVTLPVRKFSLGCLQGQTEAAKGFGFLGVLSEQPLCCGATQTQARPSSTQHWRNQKRALAQ